MEFNQFEYKKDIDERLTQYDKKFDILFKEFNKDGFNQKIFFEGQVWDSYSLIIKIIKSASKKILIIDNISSSSINKV